MRFRVMTFNLRFENDQDGRNSWSCRRDLVLQVIEKTRPHIIGTQEGRPSQLLYLERRLPDYVLHSPNRFWDPTCQYPTLFFRRDTFRAVEGSEFWLSRTPGVHRSKDWDSAFPRMVSIAKLGARENGPFLWAAVTHLDHAGGKARREQAGILAQWASRRAGPTILMGDFNDAPGSSTHTLLVNPKTGLTDSWEALGRGEGTHNYTHHGFQGVPRNGRLDWILASSHFRILEAQIVRNRFNGRYPSDHYPYMVDLDWMG